jgi:hypothetical protein
MPQNTLLLVALLGPTCAFEWALETITHATTSFTKIAIA